MNKNPKKGGRSRRVVDHIPEEVANPNLRLPGVFDEQAYYRSIMKSIGEDYVGAPSVDFFHGTVVDEDYSH